ncbi:MAG: energy-coupling factor transporter ATPase [Candidatus Eremiobacteraeota bacterium]|nr:energy-coupling factor transporter ATPase [Candidatus Eremiobacteraeota bacterium]
MIEICNLHFEYNKGTAAEIHALCGIEAVIHKGEFIAVLGHNGCGKSTLAEHLNALLVPCEGDVMVEGKNTRDHENIWEIRKLCGMVFQNPDNQMVATVVEEEVAFGPENLGVPPEDIRKRVDMALEAVGIGVEKAKASSSLLSGGQKQRLAIAGIIAMHPQYIIFDEATSMLDPHGRQEVLKTAKKLNKEDGVTVIYITHSMEEAVSADRIIVMEKGKVVMEGKPAEIFSQVEKMKKLRLDVPPMTELAYKLKKEGLDISEDILTIDEMEECLVSILPPD